MITGDKQTDAIILILLLIVCIVFIVKWWITCNNIKVIKKILEDKFVDNSKKENQNTTETKKEKDSTINIHKDIYKF